VTHERIANAVHSAHWWTRRGICKDDCSCEGCVSSSVLLYLYEQYSRKAPAVVMDAEDCGHV
jgi:hypothetical protein